MLTLLLLHPALAETPIAAGELSGNAYTLPAHSLRLQIFSPSGYGVTDELEVRSSLLGLFGGPNATVEYGLRRETSRAISLSASASTLWTGGYIGGSVGGIYSLVGDTGNRLSFGGAVGFAAVEGAAGVSLPLNVSYELIRSPQTLWSLFASADPLLLASGSTLGSGAGASWTRGWEHYRLTLGAVLADVSDINTALEDAGLDPLPASFLPIPYLLMWWMI
jgi:hypothetical protein